MMRQSPGTWLMTGFIGIVIVAGLFGPYMISLVLAGLSALCFIGTRLKDRAMRNYQKRVV